MKKEFGKWLMDIAKYITTAVILTTALSDINDKIMLLAICGITVLFTLSGGLFLLRDKEKDVKLKKK